MTIKNAVLFVNTKKENALPVSDLIKKELEKRNIKTYVFAFMGKPGNPPIDKFDLAFSLGGDGTVLYTARCMAPLNIPILPVNLGTLGFIAGVCASGSTDNDWLSVFEKWEKGEITAGKRCMLEVSVERDTKIFARNICLNDIVISASGIAKLINLDVNMNTPTGIAGLGFYRCDGLIVATATGSTAYSMAAGGPILDPEMEAMILSPICPFSLSNRSIVLPPKDVLAIDVKDVKRSDVILTVDGQDTYNLKGDDKVYVKKAEYYANLIYADRHNYYSALREKLFK